MGRSLVLQKAPVLMLQHRGSEANGEPTHASPPAPIYSHIHMKASQLQAEGDPGSRLVRAVGGGGGGGGFHYFRFIPPGLTLRPP